MRSAVLIASIAAASAALPAQQRNAALLYGTFSNLHYIDEGAGDLLGYELTIVPQYRRPYAVFQCAEGVPIDPVLVPLQVNGSNLSFEVTKTGMCDGKYTGRITTSGLNLHVANSTQTEQLPRKTSYWSKR